MEIRRCSIITRKRRRTQDTRLRIQDSKRRITCILRLISCILCLAYFAAWDVSAQDWIYDNIMPGIWENEDLNDVYFVGDQGWAVGTNGAIAHTHNGTRWHDQISSIGNDDLNGIYFLDDAEGWIVGDDGVVLHTRDSGITWREMAGSGVTTSADLYDVCFIENKYLWAVGKSGKIISTGNGGATWSTADLGSANLYAMYFFSNINGWVVGSNGAIHHWNGSNWSKHQSNTTNHLRGIYFTSNTEGWIVGDGGVILHTIDGSKWISWQSHADAGTLNLYSVYFPQGQSDYGWIAGEDGVILRTSDSGSQWLQSNNRPTNKNLNAVGSPNNNKIWAVGDDGIIVQSPDRGNTWNAFGNPPYGDFRDVSFSTIVLPKLDYRGWIVGDDGVILKMEDDGSGWREHPCSTDKHLYSIHMLTKYSGWAVGIDGTAIRFDTTTDDITRWNLEDSSTDEHLRGVFFIDQFNGWAVGDNGTIRYIDSGTWKTQNSPNTEDLNGVYFVSSYEGWVVGNQGTVLHTTNGGNYWEKIDVDTNRHLHGIYFVDANNGWIVGNGGFILYWHDGVFTEQKADSSHVLYDVDFVDSSKGWIAASDRMAISTPNGGDRWDSYNVNLARGNLYGIDFSNWSTGIAVGEAGTVLRYTRATPAVEMSLISPSGDITTSTPTFVWETSKPNLEHRIFLDDDSSLFQNPIMMVSVSGSTSFTLDIPLEPDTYYWGIELDDGSRSRPEYLQFTVWPTTEVTPISPSGFIAETVPSFQWNSNNEALSDKGSIEYTLFIDDDETPYDGGISIPVDGDLSHKLSSSDPWPTLSEGKHSWGIRTSGLDNVDSRVLVFTVDLSPPTGIIVINNGDSSTNSLMVTLTLSASDSILPGDNKGSGVAEMRLSNDGLTWSAPEPFNGAMATKEWGLPQYGGSSNDGEKTVYVQYRDVLGHWMTTSAQDTIKLDTTPPTGAVLINDGAEVTGPGDVTLSLSAFDEPDGFAPGGQMVLSNDGKNWSSLLPYETSRNWDLTLKAYGGNDDEGTKTVYVKYIDAAGNWMTQPANDSIKLDTTEPTGTIAINDGDELTNSTLVHLTLSASDENSVASMQFTNGGDNWSSWENYSIQRQNWDLSQYGGNSEDGIKTVYARFRDAVGNISVPAASDSIELKSAVFVSVQIQAPKIQGKIRNNDIVEVGGDSEPDLIEVTPEVLDENNDTLDIDLTGVAYDAGTGKISGSFNVGEAIAAAKTIKLKLTVKDVLGNPGGAVSNMLTVDNDPPTDIKVAIDQGELVNSTSITLSLSATDAAEMYVDGDIEAQKTWIAYTNTLAVNLTAGDGAKQVTVKFRDDMENESDVVSDQTLLDTTPPIGSIVINNDEALTMSFLVTLKLSATDDSGVESYQLRNDGGAWTDPLPYTDRVDQWDLKQGGNDNEGTRTVEVKYKDKVGNWSESVSDDIIVDISAPTISAWTVDDKQEAMEPVVMRAVIEGDSAIVEANLHYGKKGTSEYTTIAMTKVPGPGNEYTAEIPGPDVTLDGIEYYFTASDGIWVSRLPAENALVKVFSFTVVDTTRPSIDHDPMLRISVNFSPEIIAIVSDTMGLKRVNLFYKPDSARNFTKVDMNPTTTPDEYSAHIPAQFYLSDVDYYIEAEDTSGNSRTSPSQGAGQPYTISFVDTELPVITHTKILDGQEAGKTIVIGAEITDNMDVAEVLLEYKVPGKSESIVVEMIGIGSYYSADIPGEIVMPGIIDYTITVSDGSPQSDDATVSHSFTVVDTTPPEIQLTFVPSEMEVHNEITIKAVVTDNVGVEAVSLYYKGVGNVIWNTVPMEVEAARDEYEATIPAQGRPGKVKLYVHAEDSYGGWSTAPAVDPQNEPRSISIIDVSPPVIEHSSITGRREAGNPVTITAKVTDDVEVVEVSLHYRTAGQSDYTIAPMEGLDTVYSGTIPGPEVVLPGVEYYIEAMDYIGAMDEDANTTTHYFSGVLPHSFIVTDTVPPEIVYDPSPVEKVLTTETIDITIIATDLVGIKEIRVFYRGEDETEFKILICSKIGDDRFSTTIPTPVAEGMLYYYIQAEDNSGNKSTSPETDPAIQPYPIFVDDNTPPAPVTRLVASSAPGGVIMLAWELSISPDTGKYNIYTDSSGGIVNYSSVYDFVDSNVKTWESPSLGEGLYIFVVRAEDKSGNEEKNTNSVSAEANATEPKPVTNLSAKSSPGGRILLEWRLSTSGDAAAYNIYSDNAQLDIDYSNPLARVNDPGTAWASGVLRDGIMYRFVVRCQDNAGNEEENTNFVNARADASPPENVTGLSSPTHQVNVWSSVPIVTVEWGHAEDTGTGLAGYSAVWDTFEGTVPPDNGRDISASQLPRSIFDTSIQFPESSNQYYFHIRPVDNADNWSQEVAHFGPILIDTEVPQPPTGLKSAPLAGGRITVDWMASESTDVDKYNIYWDNGTGSGIDYSKAIGVVSTLSWASDALEDGIKYQFGVRAEDKAGNEEKNTQETSNVADGEPPVIVHEPIAGLLEQEIISVLIEAMVTDASALDRVELHYRKRGEANYTDVDMTEGTGNIYKVEIPSSAFSSAGVDYYISASDVAGNVSTHDVLTIVVTSVLEIPIDASGDDISIGHSTSLIFPAGAVSAGTSLQVRVPIPAPEPQMGLRKHIITRQFGLLPLGTILSAPINLTLRYSNAEAIGEDESKLALYLWDGQRWNFLDAVDPQTDQASITTMKLGIFSIIGDSDPPSMGELQPSGYAESDTPITARIEDNGSGIDPQGIEVMINGQSYDVPGTALRGEEFSFTLPENHKPGSYSLQLVVKDNVGNETTMTSTFQVEGELALKDVYCFPNPFQPTRGVHFAYTLTEAVNKVTIWIFGMDGKLVYKIDDAPTLVGENLKEWNCEDELGELVLSSVYICYIEAEGPEETIDKTIKIAGWE